MILPKHYVVDYYNEKNWGYQELESLRMVSSKLEKLIGTYTLTEVFRQ